MHIYPMAKQNEKSKWDYFSRLQTVYTEFQNLLNFLTFKNCPYLLEDFVCGISRCYLTSVAHSVSFQNTLWDADSAMSQRLISLP